MSNEEKPDNLTPKRLMVIAAFLIFLSFICAVGAYYIEAPGGGISGLEAWFGISSGIFMLGGVVGVVVGIIGLCCFDNRWKERY